MASRCVRPSYRTELVRPGDRVLLWVSGAQRDLPAGIHASGRVTGPVVGDLLPVRLAALAHPVTRSELRGHPDLASLEVLRMPAGSNPSWVTRAQLAALEELGLGAAAGQDPASEWRGLSGFSSELR